MIRRVTPNKSLRSNKNRVECCGWMCGKEKEANKSQVRFTMGDKNTKIHRQKVSSQTATTVGHPSSLYLQDNHKGKVPLTLNFDDKSSSLHNSFTPRTSLKVYNYKADTIKTTFRTTTPGTMSTQIKDDFRQLPDPKMPSTPLQRMRKRTLFKRQTRSPVGKRLFDSSAKETTLKKHSFSSQSQQICISKAIKRSIMGPQQPHLSQKVALFKIQYQHLLLEHKDLLTQKQNNKKYYETLLLKLGQAQQTLTKKHQKSKQNLQFLKKQLQIFIKKQQQ